METKSNKLLLNRVGNEFIDLAAEWNVDIVPIAVGQTDEGQDIVGLGIQERGSGEVLPMGEVHITPAYRRDLPPTDWDEFLNKQMDTFVKKDSDYRHKYTRGLMKYGVVIWRWEVEKKLDRIRTWVERGELKVQGEGVNNAVGDLFNYTVLYEMYLAALKNSSFHDQSWADPLSMLTEDQFYKYAAGKDLEEWIDYLEEAGHIESAEIEVKKVIYQYMGGGLSIFIN